MTVLSALVCAAAASCGGGDSSLPTGPSPVAASVQFETAAVAVSGPATALTPLAPLKNEAFVCEGVSRIYPSWWGFTHATMLPAGPGRWAALFEDVPVGRQSVRVEAPVGCEPSILSANDTALSADGARAFTFTFTLHPDGSVTR